MKLIAVIVILGMMMALPLAAAQTDGGIHADEVDEMAYKFSLPYVTNATAYRWVFGDGASSTEASPVHEYAERALYNVQVEVDVDNATWAYSYPLELRELLDTEEQTLNVGDLSIPGSFLLVSCFVMFSIARMGLHPFAQILGKGGKDVVCFLYLLGIAAGVYLVFDSVLYGGA